MSNDTRLQCTCSAFFPTSSSFHAHIEEYRTREVYLSDQLKVCRSHSKANDDYSDGDYHDPNAYEEPERPGNEYICPFQNCDRQESFKTGQKLRRHFEQHVQCHEVCVYCRCNFTRARDFIRHAKLHKNESMIKSSYMNMMCGELRNRTSYELGLAEKKRTSRVQKSNKRACEVGDGGSETSDARNAKLPKLGGMDKLNSQPTACLGSLGTAYPGLYQEEGYTGIPVQLTTAFLSSPNVVEPIAGVDFSNISAKALYPDIEPASVSGNMNYSAPINAMFNWPPASPGAESRIF